MSTTVKNNIGGGDPRNVGSASRPYAANEKVAFLCALIYSSAYFLPDNFPVRNGRVFFLDVTKDQVPVFELIRTNLA
jgi:hypothetical protein